MKEKSGAPKNNAPAVREGPQAQGAEVEGLGPEWFIRFEWSQRVEHVVLLVSFVVLVVTGLPQRFADQPWAQWTILWLGGIDSARFFHRTFALVFVAEALYHLGGIGFAAMRSRLRPTMVPTLKDARDTMLMLRYCLGLAEEKPKFDRYEYRQKFEYWGILFGGFIMIVTGFILWFPLEVTAWLPGELIPAAKEAHGNEALLALLVVVVWHLYSVLFSPAHFPGDYSIFTGRISRKRMLEEHPLEYARLMAQQRSGRQVKKVPTPEPGAFAR